MKVAKDTNLSTLTRAAMLLAIAGEMEADVFAGALGIHDSVVACKRQECVDAAASRLLRAGVAVCTNDAAGRVVHIRSTVYA